MPKDFVMVGFAYDGVENARVDVVEANIVSLVYSGAGPSLFALSLMCGVLSLFPRKLPAPRAASVPTKHPLD
jgi:hypothetical protein